ncbi:radical SAM protein [Hominifimenecus sp. rT4P-3]|uniref:radical SAM protein n=1 Tax=Hominifimenecus sp. rT4P-3 TaxID=3242979 RepID=UPI003DA5EC0A
MQEEDKKNRLEDCVLCPRECHVNRAAGERGFCGMTDKMKIARADLHMWEEPCISGEKGSGTVFFTGCSLQCVFCQNHVIACDRIGWEVTVEELVEIFFQLKEKGAANINLVTPGHFAEPVARALKAARNSGLSLPVICNTSGYEKVETLRLWDGLIDVYLPDFKYMDRELAGTYSHAKAYPDIAKRALGEMVRQTGECVFDEDGYIKKGVIVRHLILPGHTKDSKDVIRYLFETYGNKIFISVMNQYTPMEWVKEYPELNRKVTRREYQKVVDFALEIGVENGFIQEGETASESFIPPFSGKES